MSSGLSIAVAAKRLASTFSGQLLQPADVSYDDARKVHNGAGGQTPGIDCLLRRRGRRCRRRRACAKPGP